MIDKKALPNQEILYHFDKNDDGTKNGSIFYMKRPGHAYALLKQPRYQDDKDFEQLAIFIKQALEVFQRTDLTPGELEEKIFEQDGYITDLEDEINELKAEN